MPQSFIESYLEHNKIYESPTSFWKWSAYATIAAVLRDNFYLLSGDRRLYPNIYVLFLAESSGHRKGAPVDLSETLVTKVNNTKVISGRSSVQAILDELARAETDKKTGRVIKPGSAIFYAAELSAGIVSDPEAINILTDIYDYKSNPYKSRLRNGPCFNLERIVLSILSASNEDMLKNFFNITAIKGGMLARTFLVIPNELRPPNSLLDVDPLERTNSLKIVYESLLEISKLTGTLSLTTGAKIEYNNWYNDFRRSYTNKKESSGIVGRIHTSALKLAIILTANKLSTEIRREEMEQAIMESIALLPNYNAFTLTSGVSDISKACGLIITSLLSANQYLLSRKQILHRHWQDGVDAEILEKAVVTLEGANLVTQIQGSGNTGLHLRLTDICLQSMGRKN